MAPPVACHLSQKFVEASAGRNTPLNQELGARVRTRFRDVVNSTVVKKQLGMPLPEASGSPHARAGRVPCQRFSLLHHFAIRLRPSFTRLIEGDCRT